MFTALLLLSLTAVIFAAPFNTHLDPYWLKWKHQHGKKYELNEDDNLRRMIWEKNFQYINLHNLEHSLGLHDFTLAMNEFGDMTHDEFVAKYTAKPRRNITRNGIEFMAPLNVDDLPATVDWREKGYVTDVKNQGQCGSCWAFSATGSLEGQHKRKTGDLVSLSEQQLVDCSGAYGNEGCGGGLMDQAFAYIKDNKGIDGEESYPYEAQDNPCRFKKANVLATCTGFVDIPSTKENELQKAVATVGPVSVAIDAGNESFQFYSSGVYNEKKCSSTLLDHGVLAIGYGNYQGKDYWLVKNSWGETWGQRGYIFMSRNKNNQCGIATEASYPTV